MLNIILLIIAVMQINTLSSFQPTWVTSNFIQAGDFAVINYVLTGNTSTPTATMAFQSTFTGLPRLGYGIFGYQGDDSMNSQMFEINRTNLTPSSFSVAVQILSTTNLWYLNVRYIAIDQAFPHHLNTFDNVPVNYSNGLLTNITIQSSTPVFYSNYINYTSQCIQKGFANNKFETPFANNKILLLITSFFSTSSASASLDLRINVSPISSQVYLINATYINGAITKLHFSMIIFDEADILNSGKYILVYQRIQFTQQGGFISLPVQFVNNMIISLTQYACPWYKCSLHFNFAFTTKNGIYGIYMPISQPRDSSRPPFSRFGFTLLYMKTWNCPSNTFFNPTSNKCQQCSISNCIQCSSLNSCSLCDSSNNYYLNPISSQCQICDSALNFFWNPTSMKCQLCSLANCIQCSGLYTCSLCDQTNNYFLNSTNHQCQICSLSYCLECSTLNTCLICDQQNNHFLNMANGLCQICSLTNCIQCLSLTTCKTCDIANGFLLSSLGTCYDQNQPIPTICGNNIWELNEQCDDGNLQNGDGCSSRCQTQQNYECLENPNQNIHNTVCYYVGQISMKIGNIQKIDSANQLQIVLQIGPQDAKFWDSVDFSSIILLDGIQFIEKYQIKKDKNGKVTIVVDYNNDIQDQNISVKIDPSLSNKLQLLKVQPLSRNFLIIPNDHQMAYFYEKETYNLAETTFILANVVAGISLLVFMCGIFMGKLIGIQMMAVIQISYLSLLTLPIYNPCFLALLNIWFVNGLNYFFFIKDQLLDQFTSIQMKKLLLSSHFIKNYNFTVLLIFVPYLVSLVLFIFSKTCYEYQKQQNLLKWSKKIACEYGFTGIMFSGYIIFVSSILQLMYGFKNINGFFAIISIIQTLILLGLMIVYFILLIKVPEYFGQFVQYFKTQNNKIVAKESSISNNIQSDRTSILTKDTHIMIISLIDRKWYNLQIIQRLISSTLLIILYHTKMPNLLLMGIFLIFALIVIIRRPYLHKRHNLRFFCNMVICLIIQIIYFVFKISFQNDKTIIKSQIYIYFPFIICVLLLICIMYSFIALIYGKYIDRKQQSYQKQQQQIFQQYYNSTKNQVLLYNNNVLKQLPSPLFNQHNEFDYQKLQQIRRQIKKDFLRQNLSSDRTLKKNLNQVQNYQDL